MLVLFAGKDINETNLKVQAGHPLPSRFQQSYFTLKSLKDTLGPDAIIQFTEDTKEYVLVKVSKMMALENEVKQLKEKLAEATKSKSAGGDKKETH